MKKNVRIFAVVFATVFAVLTAAIIRATLIGSAFQSEPLRFMSDGCLIVGVLCAFVWSGWKLYGFGAVDGALYVAAYALQSLSFQKTERISYGEFKKRLPKTTQGSVFRVVGAVGASLLAFAFLFCFAEIIL